MNAFLTVVFFTFLLLVGCQQSKPVGESVSTTVSSAISTVSSVMPYAHWKTYHSDTLSISVDYPLDEYSVSESGNLLQFGENQIAIEGIRIGDQMAEGNGVHLFRTKDTRINQYLQQEKQFTGKKTVNGTEYQRFEFVGMGDTYGYITEKDGQYYVFQFMWGPDNPISEKMLQSLIYEQ